MTHQWTDSLGRPIDCIHREARQLVGLTHPNKRGADRRPLWRQLLRGTPLVLVPEPDNAFDRNAILIYRADDLANDLGYMHATGAKRICPLIERGAIFTADVYWINNKSEFYPEVYMYIYQMTEPIRHARPQRRRAAQYPPSQIAERASEPTVEQKTVQTEVEAPRRIDVDFDTQTASRSISLWQSLQQAIVLLFTRRR